MSATVPPPADDINALLTARYGGDAPTISDPDVLGSDVLALLLAHRSVRRFSEAPVGDDAVTAIVAAAQSAATSSNNQSVSIVEVRDAATRARFVDAARASAFVRDAPVILLFLADWARGSAIAAWSGEPAEAVGYLESTLVAFVDAGIAAQNAVVAAEALGLGTCYLGSLRNEPAILAAELAVPQGAVVAFGLAIGHPDALADPGIKPRLPQRAFRHRETYREVVREDVEAYDGTIGRYYATRGRPHSWAQTVIARVRDIAGLHGRETMRRSLGERGLPSR